MSAVNPVGIVQSTTHAIVSERNGTPFFWSQTFETVHKVHIVWKTVEKALIYGNPDNFVKLMAGHTLSSVAGENIFVKIGSTAVLIAMRIMECVKEKLLLLKEIHKLYRALFDTSFLTPNVPWVKPGDKTFISPSFTYYFRSLARKFIDQLMRVIRLLLGILKQIFFLSMRMISAADAFSMDPATIREGTRELFVNYERCSDALSKNREMLLDFMKEYKSVIVKVLNGLGNVCTYETIIRKLTESKEEPGRFTLKKYGYFAFQHMMFGLFQSVNLHYYMPKKWIPPLEAEWWVEDQNHPRYPPESWVQIYGHENFVKEWQKGAEHYAGESVFFNKL